MVSLGADRMFTVGIKNDEIGVTANRDRSFSRIQAKEFCRSGGNQFDESIHAETSRGDAAGVNQAHAMLNAGTTVRNLREVVASEFFLLLETEWTVIGRHDLQMIAFEAVPELFLMPLFAKRRCKNIFRAFKAGNIEVFDREIQVLRAGLGIDRKAAVARLPNLFEGFIAAKVHDVDRSSRHLR